MVCFGFLVSWADGRTILVGGFLVGWWILGGWLFVCRFWLVGLFVYSFVGVLAMGLCFVFIWWFGTNDDWFWGGMFC